MNTQSSILVVEDDPQIRQVNYIILSRAGYRVDLADNGQTAWEILRKSHYDLVLTDNSMPKMKGFELLRKMQAAGIQIPVILASAPLSPSDEAEFQGLKVEGRVVKPFRLEELLGAVRSVLTNNIPREVSKMWHAA